MDSKSIDENSLKRVSKNTISNINDIIKELIMFEDDLSVSKLLHEVKIIIRRVRDKEFLDELRKYCDKQFTLTKVEKLLTYLSTNDAKTIVLYFGEYEYYYVFSKPNFEKLFNNTSPAEMTQDTDIYQAIHHRCEKSFMIYVSDISEGYHCDKGEFSQILNRFKVKLIEYLNTHEYCNLKVEDIKYLGSDLCKHMGENIPFTFVINKIQVKETDEICAKVIRFKNYLLENKMNDLANIIDKRQFNRNSVYFQHIPTNIFLNDITNIDDYFALQI